MSGMRSLLKKIPSSNAIDLIGCQVLEGIWPSVFRWSHGILVKRLPLNQSSKGLQH